jgi:secreted trypsin-like serine protease
VAALVLAATAPPAAHAVAGGAPSEPQPWMATLAGKRGGSLLDDHRCGGVLVAPDRILTAAHCVQDAGPRSLRVVVGRGVLSAAGAGQGVAVRGFSVLPGARLIPSPFSEARGSEAADRDLALVVLARPVAGAVPLGLAAAPPPAGAPVTVLGHGRTGPGLAGAGTQRPIEVTPEEAQRAGRAAVGDVLQRAGQVVVDPAACRATYGRLLRPGALCTVDPDPARNAHACAGDSGGPVVADGPAGAPVLAGIVSWGGEVRDRGCGEGREPDVAMDVSAHLAWITQAAPALAPIPEGRGPRVVVAGSRLRCRPGAWRGDDVTFAFRWTRRNRVVARTASVALRRSGALQCTVTARTAGGTVTRRAALWRAR